MLKRNPNRAIGMILGMSIFMTVIINCNSCYKYGILTSKLINIHFPNDNGATDQSLCTKFEIRLYNFGDKGFSFKEDSIRMNKVSLIKRNGESIELEFSGFIDKTDREEFDHPSNDAFIPSYTEACILPGDSFDLFFILNGNYDYATIVRNVTTNNEMFESYKIYMNDMLRNTSIQFSLNGEKFNIPVLK
jgi:hypothetical protein